MRRAMTMVRPLRRASRRRTTCGRRRDPDQHHARARTRGLHRDVDRRVGARHLEGHVDADPRREVLGRDHLLGAGALGGRAPMLERIHGQHDASARRARDLDEQQPDRAAPDDGDVGAEVHVAEVEGVDGHAQGLEHGAVDAVHRVRERVQRLGRPAEVPAQAAVQPPWPAKTTSGQRFWSPAGALAVPAVQRGIDRDRRPSSGPPSTTPANS